MSSSFYGEVSRLYHLLDLDGDGRLDREEARLGFSTCFADVHRSTESLSGSKDAILDQQVTWLFTAAADDSPIVHSIDEHAFKACYQKLLAAAYEEEVLLVDLKRAIASLESSKEWREMGELFVTVRSIYGAASSEERLSMADSKQRAILETLFAPITGRSTVLGPRSQTAARKLVAPLLVPESHLPLDHLITVLKQILAIPIPVELLKKSAEDALQIANGSATSPNNSSASSSSTTSAPMEN